MRLPYELYPVVRKNEPYCSVLSLQDAGEYQLAVIAVLARQ